MHPKQVDMGKESKGKQGGTRPGSGRPRKTEETRTYTFRASGEMVRHLDMQEAAGLQPPESREDGRGRVVEVLQDGAHDDATFM